MQKLRNSNIAKMIAAKITNKEIDFLIYISRFQDDNGKYMESIIKNYVKRCI